MGPDMHLHVVHRFMVAWVGPFDPKFLWRTNGRSKVANARIGANQVRSSPQIHCMVVMDGYCKHNGWYNANYHVVCAFRCLRTRSSNSRCTERTNWHKWTLCMVNTPNGEKKVCSVRHGTHTISYSPCDVWYNTLSRVVCVHVPKINPFKLSILGEKTTTFLGTKTNRPRVTLD